MRKVRCYIVVPAMLALAACASAPTKPPLAHAAHAELRLCPGMGIANAPPADGYGRLIGYDPFINAGGVTLVRAPVAACVSSGYGARGSGAGSFHNGVDLYTRTPAPVYAGGNGVVEAIETLRGYGRTVLIRHSRRVKTRYAHLSSYAEGLKPGARVRQGQLIGRTGRTGNATAVHLHYEILVDGRSRDPLALQG